MTKNLNDIKLKKMGFRTLLPNAHAFYQALEYNRERLSPWFWWADKNITPNFGKTILFGVAYILDTKLGKLKYNIGKSKTYDEQFLVFNGKEFVGMTGLDAIDSENKKAELWYFVTNESEGKGIASESLKIISDYSLGKGIDLLYAKTAKGNDKSEAFLKRNKFDIAKIEVGVKTSKRNPKITDLTTWEKDIR